MQFLSKSFTPLIPSSTRRKILKITINVVSRIKSNLERFHATFSFRNQSVIILSNDAISSTMSMTRYATLCQWCRIFVVRVPLLFGACRRVRIKGRRPRPRRAKSRLPWRLLSLSVPAITQWSRTRGPFDRSFSSIESYQRRRNNPGNRPPRSSLVIQHFFFVVDKFNNFSENLFHLRKVKIYIYIYILFLEREICRLDGRKLKEFPEMLLSNFQDYHSFLKRFWV